MLYVFVEGLYSVKTDISRPTTVTVASALDPPSSITVPRLVDQMAFAPVKLLSVCWGSKIVNKLVTSGRGTFETRP